jgi:hypothetical protein
VLHERLNNAQGQARCRRQYECTAR